MAPLVCLYAGARFGLPWALGCNCILNEVAFTLLCTGQLYSRTFFSRTVPTSEYEDNPASIDNSCDVPRVAVDTENLPSSPLQNSSSATYHKSSSRGGPSKRSPREGRGGRSNWHQRNGFRKPGAQPSADAVVKTQPNSGGDSPPSSTEIRSTGAQPVANDVVKTGPNVRADFPSLSAEIRGSSSPRDAVSPLPQRNRPRQSYTKERPSSMATNSTQTIET